MSSLPQRFVRTVWPAVLVCGFAAAQQTVVSPAAWGTVESPSGNAFPFGSASVPYRYLNVHDDMAGHPGLIQAFALRRSGTTSSTVVPAFSVTLDGYMSTAAVTGATILPTFDSDHGPDKAQVLNGRTVSFPAADTGLLPYPFSYVIPLDAPFAFGGTGPLCWEVQITARSGQPSNLIHDFVSGTSSNPSMVASWYGTGCLASGATARFRLTGASNNSWPGGTIQMSATAQNGPANAPVVLLVGLDPTDWNGIPLPFALPGTGAGASGTCYVQAPGTVQLGALLSSSGTFTFHITAPADPMLNGGLLYSQVVALDVNANAFGLVTSSGLNHQIVAPYGAQPGGRVYQAGSLSASGTANPGGTLVVQFRY